MNVLVVLAHPTSNTPEARERAAFDDPLEALWKRCLFGLCASRACAGGPSVSS